MLDALPPFFVRDGERCAATISTRGPWNPGHQHGGPPAALCARALEQLAGKGALLARMTFDFLRPVPIAPLSVKAERVRAGRSVQRLRAVLLDEAGTELVHATAVALRTAPAWGDASVMAWMRAKVPLVADEPTSPVQRLLVNVDSASGLAETVDPKRDSWVNADLTVALHRMPDGDWIGLDVVTTVEAHGVGLTRARLRDASGPVGMSLQSLVIEPRRG